MPLRFHKQIKLGDFVKLNINKKSVSLSAGVRGFHFNIGREGPMVNIDLPGGLSYRKHLGKSKKEKAEDARKAKDTESPPVPTRAKSAPAVIEAPPAEAPPAPESEPAAASADVPLEEQPFQLGFIAYQHADFVNAYRHFTGLVDTPYRADALFMAGTTAGYVGRDDEAVTYLASFLEEGQPPFPGDPESLVTRYLPEATVNVQITHFTAVDLPLEPTAALLLYVEWLQLDKRLDVATAILEDVFQQNPAFRLAQLSLADLYLQQGRYDDIFKLFSEHTPELAAEDDVAVEMMVYWARALTARQMFDAANKVYRRALARRKGISPELRLLALYAQADLFERRGKPDQARKTFERVFAEAPDFYDVQQRLAALSVPQLEQ